MTHTGTATIATAAQTTTSKASHAIRRREVWRLSLVFIGNFHLPL
jgi:hypothetical protein